MDAYARDGHAPSVRLMVALISARYLNDPVRAKGLLSGLEKELHDESERSLAKELGPRKIRVNSLDPGLVETEGTHAEGILEGDFRDNVIKNTPLGRVGSPDDIGPVAVFLASDAAYWVNGSRILAGGGLTI